MIEKEEDVLGWRDNMNNRDHNYENNHGNNLLHYGLAFLAGAAFVYFILQNIKQQQASLSIQQQQQQIQAALQATTMNSPTTGKYENDERYHITRGEDGFIIDLEIKREAEVA